MSEEEKYFINPITGQKILSTKFIVEDYYKKCEEVERLNKERENDIKYNKYLQKELAKSNNIIKEVREYIKDKWEMELKDSMEDFLDHDELIDRKRLLHILEILNKEK